MEGTLGIAERAPLRGGTQEAALLGGPAKAGFPAASLAKAGSLGELVPGVRSVHPARSASPAGWPRARDRRCPGHEGRGSNPRREQSRLGAFNRRKPCRTPDPRKLGWPIPERGEATRRGASRGQPSARGSGAREIPVVLVNRTDCRRHRSALHHQAKAGGRGAAAAEGALAR